MINMFGNRIGFNAVRPKSEYSSELALLVCSSIQNIDCTVQYCNLSPFACDDDGT